MTTNFWIIPRPINSVLANGRPNPSLIRPVAPRFLTAAASDEWRFGLDSWSLTGIVNRSIITPYVDAPTFVTTANGRNTLILAASSTTTAPNGLLTPYNEVTNETHCVVVRNVALSGMMLGTMSTNTGDGGFGVYRQGGNVINFLTRGILSGVGSNGISAFTVGGVAPTNMAIFIAVSHSATTRLAYVGGIGSDTKTGTRVLSTGPRKVSLGNVWYNFPQQTQICAYMRIPATKVTSDIDGYYADAKRFMALRGTLVY